MKKIFRLVILISIVSMCLGAPSTASAQPPWPDECWEDSLPSNDPQYPADQMIVTCIPANWNGQLVLYAHGYEPEQNPLSLPTDELFLEGTFLPVVLMSQGFAFATTSYHKNGYAVEQARKDLNNLITYVKRHVPHGFLQKVFLVGASEGGEIAAMMIERYPDKYAGALALCGPIGGASYEVQYLSDFRVVFDYFFPAVFPFGAADVPEDAYLNWSNYTATIAVSMITNPIATTQLYSVTGAAFDPYDPTTTIATALGILYYSIWGTNDLLSTAAGMPYDNRATVYSGSFNDEALNAGVERIRSDRQARVYLRRFYQPTGELQRPLVTLHNLLDPVVPFHHEEIYQNLASNAGNGDLFTPITVSRYGHCNFTLDEVNNAFSVLLMEASTLAGP